MLTQYNRRWALKGHKGPINTLSFLEEATYLASGGGFSGSCFLLSEPDQTFSLGRACHCVVSAIRHAVPPLTT